MLVRCADKALKEICVDELTGNVKHLCEKIIPMSNSDEKTFGDILKTINYDSFLPNTEFVSSFREEIENILRQNGFSNKVDEFAYRFNYSIQEEFNRRFLNKDFDALNKPKIYKYIEKAIKEGDFKMIDDDKELPLKDYYIWHRGSILQYDKWGEITEEFGDSAKSYLFEKLLPVSNNICFIGAEFGVGKSSFMRMIAFELAKKFKSRWEGYIPIFFKLRDYDFKRLKNHINKSLEDIKAFDKNLPVLIILDGLDEFSNFEEFDFTEIEKICYENSNVNVVITSRFIEKEKMKEIIRRYSSNGTFLRLLTFDEEQVELWLNETKCGLSYDDLKEIGLSKEEISKPLYLWMIWKLKEFGELDKIMKRKDISRNYARSRIYMLFMNLVSRGKIKRIGKKEVVESTGVRTFDEKLARRLLRQIASLKNLYDNLTPEIIKRELEDKDREIFERFGEDTFLVLTYFFVKGEKNVEFIHKSFKEYLLAEYYLECVFENKWWKLLVGVPSEETIDFLEGIIEILCNAINDKEDSELCKPFLESLGMDVNSLEDIISRTIEMAFDWFLTEMSCFRIREYSILYEGLTKVIALKYNYNNKKPIISR